MKIAATNRIYDVDGETIVNKAYVGSDLVWLATSVTVTNSGSYYPAANADDIYCMHYGDSSYYFRPNMDTWDLIGRGIDDGERGAITYYSFIRFNNVTIPQGSIISSAVLRLVCRSAPEIPTYTCNALISFENADNPSAPTSHDDMEARTRTSDIEWNDIAAWVGDVEYETPELKTVLQTVIDREGFASGNAVIAFIRNNNSDENVGRTYCSYNHGHNYPELYVEWEE